MILQLAAIWLSILVLARGLCLFFPAKIGPEPVCPVENLRKQAKTEGYILHTDSYRKGREIYVPDKSWQNHSYEFLMKTGLKRGILCV